MMKDCIIRESKHIVTVYTLEKKPAAYNIAEESETADALQCILHWHWAEKVDERDGFIFVKPTDILLKIMKPD